MDSSGFHEQLNSLLQQYEAGALALEEAVFCLTPDQLDFHPLPGKWSIRQIAAHLADTELMYTSRIRKIAAEHSGLLVNFEQDEWVDRLGAEDLPIRLAVELIGATRRWQAFLLRRLPMESYQLTGTHELDGEVSLYALVDKVSGHLYHHLAQIRAISNGFSQ